MDLKQNGRPWTKSGSRQGKMVCCCEQGNEYSDSIQFGEFLDWLSKGTINGCCPSPPPKPPKPKFKKHRFCRHDAVKSFNMIYLSATEII
jgi:hypothetical protein